MGRCIRPSVWTGFQFYHARWSWRSFFLSAYKYPRFRFRFGSRHSFSGLLISVSARNIYMVTRATRGTWLSVWCHVSIGIVPKKPGRVGSWVKILTRFHHAWNNRVNRSVKISRSCLHRGLMQYQLLMELYRDRDGHKTCRPCMYGYVVHWMYRPLTCCVDWQPAWRAVKFDQLMCMI